MLHTTPPPGFTPKCTIVGCCIEKDGKILILKRAVHKPQGGMWGLPAGKVDEGENTDEAVMREMFEETGIRLERKDIGEPRTWHVALPYVSFTWVVYRIVWEQSPLTPLSKGDVPVVKLRDDEHTEFGWFTPEESLAIGLIDDLDATIIEMYDLRIEPNETSS